MLTIGKKLYFFFTFRNFTKKVASLCGLVKKVKEVKFFARLSLHFAFSHSTLKNEVKASKSPNPSLSSLIVRKFTMNGVRTPNYILTFSEELK